MVAHDHFGVGTHIHQNARLFLPVKAGKQDPGDQVAPEVTADVGEDQHPCIRVDCQTQIPCFLNTGTVHGRDIRFANNKAGLKPHEQMGHGGVSRHGQQVDVGRCQVAGAAELFDMGV